MSTGLFGNLGFSRNKRITPPLVKKNGLHQQPEMGQGTPYGIVAKNGSQRHGSPLISMRGVKKAYHTAAGEFWALRGIDLEIYPGEYLLIIGKSGSGKTTLVNMITGVDRLSEGIVDVGTASVHDLDENNQALWRGLNLGVIYQSFQLMPTLSLMDNVLLPMDFCGLYRGRQSHERAGELLSNVGLKDHQYKLPAAVSGGQQQRVAIARALANDPPIIVADEPTGRLDSVTAAMIFDIFEELVRNGKTLVMVTHDRNLMQRVLKLPNGRVVELQDGHITKEWKGTAA
jgi:putative ABC transport system ATP-binding protein